MAATSLISLVNVPVSVSLIDAAPTMLPLGSRFSLPVRLINQANRALASRKSNPLVLGYRWYDAKGEGVWPDGPRTPLPARGLAAGASVELVLAGTTPEEEGAYKLYVSLLLEGVEWAYQVSSTGWCEAAVDISAAPEWPGELSNSPGARALRGALAAAEIARSLEDRFRSAASAPGQGSGDADGHDEVAADETQSSSAPLPQVGGIASANPKQEIDELLSLAARQERRVAELLSELGRRDRQISELEEQVRTSGGLKGLRDDLAGQATKMQLLLEDTSAIQRELRQGSFSREVLSSLRQLVAWSASTTNNIGEMSQEMSSSLRQLVAWSATMSDSGSLSEESLASLRQLVVWSATMSKGTDERWQAEERRFDAQSVKLDTLLLRQSIPLPNAGVVLVRNKFGMLAIQDDDALAVAHYSWGELPEPATVVLVDGLLEPGSCFVDVGANVGVYSLVAGRRVGSHGRVISIEPTPSTMRALRITLAINGLTDIVQTHECALGKEEGTGTLNCESISAHNTLLPASDATRESHTVPIRTGDALLSGINPNLIKIDVEGWELEALAGLSGVIGRSKELSLIVEYSPTHVNRRGLRAVEWFESLQSCEFGIWAIRDEDISLRSVQSADELGDRAVNLFLSRDVPPALRAMIK